MNMLEDIEQRVLLAGAIAGLALVLAGVKLWEMFGTKPCDCHKTDGAVTVPASDG